MKNIYEKACNKEYFEKHNKQGDLLRVAEKFGNFWVVWEYPKSRTNYEGEYNEKEFKSLKLRWD